MHVHSQKYTCTLAGYLNNLRVLYSGSQVGASAQKSSATTRHIPQQPERILDAPELLDDFCECQSCLSVSRVNVSRISVSCVSVSRVSVSRVSVSRVSVSRGIFSRVSVSVVSVSVV